MSTSRCSCAFYSLILCILALQPLHMQADRRVMRSGADCRKDAGSLDITSSRLKPRGPNSDPVPSPSTAIASDGLIEAKNNTLSLHAIDISANESHWRNLSIWGKTGCGLFFYAKQILKCLTEPPENPWIAWLKVRVTTVKFEDPDLEGEKNKWLTDKVTSGRCKERNCTEIDHHQSPFIVIDGKYVGEFHDFKEVLMTKYPNA